MNTTRTDITAHTSHHTCTDCGNDSHSVTYGYSAEGDVWETVLCNDCGEGGSRFYGYGSDIRIAGR